LIRPYSLPGSLKWAYNCQNFYTSLARKSRLIIGMPLPDELVYPRAKHPLCLACGADA
jgi:hypothetical protein